MIGSNRKFYTRIIYQTTEQITDQFNGQTTMDEIHPHIREKLGYCLRNPYLIQVRHPETKKMVNLNQNLLNNEYNPFKIRSLIDYTDISSLFNMVELHVIDYLPDNPEPNQQPSMISNLLQPNSTPKAVAKESKCQQDLLVKNNTTNKHISHAKDLSGALLTHEPHELPVNNDCILERALGNTIPMQNNLIVSDRLSFSHDVKPVQKPIYMSDQFNQRDKTKTNGLVSYIQGIKTEQKAKSSVLPRIRLAGRNRNKRNAWIDIHAVYQKRLANGKICWIKHPNKGFLPKVYTCDTLPVNPISIPLDEINLSEKDDFELSLRMTTKWDKSGTPEEEVHQLDEKLVANLHPIVSLEPNKYDPCTPRLMGTIREGNITLWHTMCLSDYIRSTITYKRAASSTNITGENNPVNHKRLKV